MLISSPTAYLSRPSGALTVEVVIAGLPREAADRFAALCDGRLTALSTAPTATACKEHVETQMGWEGWNDQGQLPAGLREAQELALFAYLLPCHGVSPEGFATLSLDGAEGAAAYAVERAWVWETLAALEGFNAMDGSVIASMAETWPLDFRSLLEAVCSATGPPPPQQ
jgi:hypothetical protein